ncbi:fascin domain-containing protein [Umezawaea tangerina]|uniref:Uncharacterized protein n=1 Tax=Umezawaea tangerina TaxID=84725 RepID=A0A2T0T7I3_9PSEU|nr:hypothetical protein [Umezawaea tangerina]PRY41598.1 hypothetical protein CLV43_105356 [Umezawaea tangerina]
MTIRKNVRARVAAVLVFCASAALAVTQPASASPTSAAPPPDASASVVAGAAQWWADPSHPNCRTVYLRSNASFYWVAAEFGAGDRRLRARTNESNGLGEWERFILRGQGYDYTLMSTEDKFASADIGTDGTLYARAGAADAWEKFNIFTYFEVDGHNTNVNVVSTANGRYVSADVSGDGTLRARATTPDLWEGFRIYLVEDNAWLC